MRFLHRDVEYSIPDDWWREAQLDDVVNPAPDYLAGPSPWPNLPTFDVAVDDIAPVKRALSHGLFNDSPESGSAHERVVGILVGLRERSPIPPVEVARLGNEASPRFKLIHGVHRLYCAIAVGCTDVPAVEVRDIWGQSREA